MDASKAKRLGLFLLLFFKRIHSLFGGNLFLRESLDVLGNNATSAIFPFGAVSNGIIQAFIARNSKNIAVFELLCKRDAVKLKQGIGM